MTADQVTYIIGSRDSTEIEQISFTSNAKAYVNKVDIKTVELDIIHSLLYLEYKDGRKEYWDFTDINGICLTK